METDIQSLYLAPIVAEEKIRGNRRERIRLGRGLKLSGSHRESTRLEHHVSVHSILSGFAKLFGAQARA